MKIDLIDAGHSDAFGLRCIGDASDVLLDMLDTPVRNLYNNYGEEQKGRHCKCKRKR